MGGLVRSLVQLGVIDRFAMLLDCGEEAELWCGVFFFPPVLFVQFSDGKPEYGSNPAILGI